MLEEKQEICGLIDIYGGLLTEKQLDVMEEYFYNDLSLSEIAEKLQITKQAVKDAIDKAKHTLEKYESVLHLDKKRKVFYKLVSCKEVLAKEEYILQLEKLFKEWEKWQFFQI